MAPPSPAPNPIPEKAPPATPPVKVNPDKNTSMCELLSKSSTIKIRDSPAASIVNKSSPAPTMVKFEEMGSCVPDKVMVAGPLAVRSGAKTSSLAAISAFASSIASRRLTTPSFGSTTSLSVVTLITPAPTARTRRFSKSSIFKRRRFKVLFLRACNFIKLYPQGIYVGRPKVFQSPIGSGKLYLFCLICAVEQL